MLESPETAIESPAPSAPDRPWGLLGVALGAVLLYLFVELYLLSGRLGFPLDDSWIHMVFARNLAAGAGLSFNAEELVPGSTALLWTALLSLFSLLPGSSLVWVKLLGVVLHLLGGFLTFALGRELGLDRVLAWLAAALSLTTSWLVWSALSGLEIPLFVVLSLAGILLHVRERREPSRLPASLPVLALSVLARPEGLLLFALALVDRCLIFGRHDGDLVWQRPRLRGLATGSAALVLLVAPVALFNLQVTGSLLPTTFGAKSQGLSHAFPEMGYLFTVFGIFFQAQPWMALLAAAGAVSMVVDLGSDRDRGLLPALWLFALPWAYGLIDQPGQVNLVGNFGRYYFPLFPLLVLLGMRALIPLARRLSGGICVFGKVVPIALLALTILLLPTIAETIQGAGRYGQTVLNVEESDVAVALWLSERLPPEAVLGVGDIGAIGYFLPNRIVDLAGIASPEIKRWGVEEFLQHYEPDYLVIFPAWMKRLFDDVSPFRVVHEIHIEDNITMADDVLAIYATPWTRFPLHPVKEPAE